MADQASDEETCRHDAQFLAHLFARRRHLRATARAVQAVGVQMGLFAVEVLRQRRATRMRSALLLRRRGLLVVRRLVVGLDRGRLVCRAHPIGEELQLIGRDLLARPTVDRTLHGRDLLHQDLLLTTELSILFTQLGDQECLGGRVGGDVAVVA